MPGDRARLERSTAGDASGTLRVELLGGFEVAVDGTRVHEASWRLRRARDVVKLLALATGHHLHREQVMEHLWPDRAPDAAANNLHQALHVARKAVEGVGGRAAMLQLHDGVVHLCPDDPLSVDVERYQAAVLRARDSGTIRDYLDARELYGGELLPDDRYEEWTTDVREALTQEHLALLWRLGELQTIAGDREGAAETFRRLVGIDPVHEAAHRGLMQLYALEGQHRLAVRQFEILRTVLDRELGVEPAEETEALRREILAGRVDDAGERLGGDRDAPAARDRVRAAPKAVAPSNLPVQLSSFIGRERELADIERLLSSTRVLTLTGVGGCGKTRLAIEGASALRPSFPDGVWFVSLAELGRSSLVIQQVADVFEVREQRGTPLLESIASHVGDGRVLLLLDNCEHLIEACAEVTQALLGPCSNLRVLATSRQPIRIAGEVVFRVPSLEIPVPDAAMDLASLASVASVELFIDRASAVAPGPVLTPENADDLARLCSRLDGLPLAIELSASRVAALPVAAIVERLDDRFRLLVGGSRTALSRQQTLKATLDWSYQLLSDEERSVLRRLAVFVGEIPLDAAEVVCEGGGVDRSAILGIVGELVDKSLVVPRADGPNARFRLLETVREYGLERLDEVGERTRYEREHARWFLELADRMHDAVPRPDLGAEVARVELDHDNIRAAFDRALADAPPLAVAFAARMWPFWLWRAHLAEGRRRIERALERSPEPSLDRAEAMFGLAGIESRSGDADEGAADAKRSAALASELGEATVVCRALQVAGAASWSLDEFDDARVAFEDAFAVAVEAGFEPGRAASTHNLGVLDQVRDPGRARTLVAEAVEAFRALGVSGQLSPPLLDLGEFVIPQRGTDGFRVAFEETFSLFQDVSCVTACGYAVANLAMLARTEGDPALARSLLEESLTLFEGIGDDRAIGQALTRLGNLALAEADLVRAREFLEASFELRRRIGDWRGIMMTQRGLGNLALAEGDVTEAGRLLEEAASTFQRRGDLWGYAAARADVASLAIERADLAGARVALDQSIDAITRTGRTRWLGWATVQSAELRRSAGEDELAEREIVEALELFERLGDHLGVERCRVLLAGSTDHSVT